MGLTPARAPLRGPAPVGDENIDPVTIVPEIRRRDLLGGLIHEYHAVAA
jgi:hypothetical protein